MKLPSDVPLEEYWENAANIFSMKRFKFQVTQIIFPRLPISSRRNIFADFLKNHNFI